MFYYHGLSHDYIFVTYIEHGLHKVGILKQGVGLPNDAIEIMPEAKFPISILQNK